MWARQRSSAHASKRMNELLQESRQVVAPLVAANPAIDLESRWHVAQTRSRHEKSVDAQLGRHSIESYLPLFDSVRKWKDRRKRLQLPLFSGYVFVRIAGGSGCGFCRFRAWSGS